MPEAGGGISRFDSLSDGGVHALMRPFVPAPDVSGVLPDPDLLACYPLLPWSNRIAHGGFFFGGRHNALQPNRNDEPYPIHGSGWQRPWVVQRHGPGDVELTLDDAIGDAYAYRARLVYRLEADALQVTLRVENAGKSPMPFGTGIHPFFPRRADTRLMAPARAMWLNDDANRLPVGRAPVPRTRDFSPSSGLPADELNHAFIGWSGRAAIEWPDTGLRLHIEADMDTYVLYTPPGEGFFCFEPVDHPINAVHLPGGPLAHGMTELAPGDSLTRSFVFRTERLRP